MLSLLSFLRTPVVTVKSLATKPNSSLPSLWLSHPAHVNQCDVLSLFLEVVRFHRLSGGQAFQVSDSHDKLKCFPLLIVFVVLLATGACLFGFLTTCSPCKPVLCCMGHCLLAGGSVPPSKVKVALRLTS